MLGFNIGDTYEYDTSDYEKQKLAVDEFAFYRKKFE
jgi:hypothetical protein